MGMRRHDQNRTVVRVLAQRAAGFISVHIRQDTYSTTTCLAAYFLCCLWDVRLKLKTISSSASVVLKREHARETIQTAHIRQ